MVAIGDIDGDVYLFINWKQVQFVPSVLLAIHFLALDVNFCINSSASETQVSYTEMD